MGLGFIAQLKKKMFTAKTPSRQEGQDRGGNKTFGSLIPDPGSDFALLGDLASWRLNRYHWFLYFSNHSRKAGLSGFSFNTFSKQRMAYFFFPDR